MLDQLAVLHRDFCGGEPRRVRGGVGVKVQLQGRTTWIPSLHIKAACKDNSIEPETQDDCYTQQRQLEALRAWMDQVTAAGDDFILAGDFNRKLLKKSDKRRKDVFSDEEGAFTFLPAQDRQCWVDFKPAYGTLREKARLAHPDYEAAGFYPWIYHPKWNREIDFFIPSRGLESAFSFESRQIPMEGFYRLGEPSDYKIENCAGDLVSFDKKALAFVQSFPSDHCPISMRVTTREF